MTGKTARQAIPDGPPAPAAPPFDQDGFIAAYEARFVEYHLAWTIFITGHLGDLRRRFGDIEDALLLAALGLGPAVAKLKDFRASGDPVHVSYGGTVGETTITNAVRLSDITGIPRQTVRRKLQAFAQQGWVEQAADRSWRLVRRQDRSAAVAADLARDNADFLRQLAQLLSRFEQLRHESKSRTA